MPLAILIPADWDKQLQAVEVECEELDYERSWYCSEPPCQILSDVAGPVNEHATILTNVLIPRTIASQPLFGDAMLIGIDDDVPEELRRLLLDSERVRIEVREGGTWRSWSEGSELWPALTAAIEIIKAAKDGLSHWAQIEAVRVVAA